MKNPVSNQVGCPATVYHDRACTELVREGDVIGWMIWGRRLTVAQKLGRAWVHFSLAHRSPYMRTSSFKAAA